MVMETVAGVGISMLATFLAKAGQPIAEKAGQAVTDAASSLFETIKKKFKGNSYAEQTLDRLEKNPESKDRQASVKDVLIELMEQDGTFATEIKKLVEAAQKADSHGSVRVGGNVGDSVIITGDSNVIHVTKTSGAEATSPTDKSTPVDVTGRWKTQELTNPFDSHAKFRLYFDFELKGDLLLGSIRQVSTKKEYDITKGILDGKIKGNDISFYVIEQSVSWNQGVAKETTYNNYYYGSVSYDEIEFTLQSDRPWGFPPQKFMAKRE